MSYGYDSNVFRQPNPSAADGDYIGRLNLGILAQMPLRRGLIEVGWEGSQFNYKKNQFSRDTGHEAFAAFTFGFSSGDEIVIRDQFNIGISDVQFINEGGERTFTGQPWRRNRWEIEWGRLLPMAQGYSLRLARTDLTFEPEPGVPPASFDYRGLEGTAEYRQPLVGQRWILASVSARRFNHYDQSILPFVGVPFRREVSDFFQVGLRGYTGERQPYIFMVGYGKFLYDGLVPGVSDSEFRGIVGSGRWHIGIGGRSALDLRFARRPLASVFNSYFIASEAEVQFDREWLEGSSTGVRVLFGRNKYGDLIDISQCSTFLRDDRRMDVGVFMNWAIRRGLLLALNADRRQRNSNCEAVEFETNILTARITYGWY